MTMIDISGTCCTAMLMLPCVYLNPLSLSSDRKLLVALHHLNSATCEYGAMDSPEVSFEFHRRLARDDHRRVAWFLCEPSFMPQSNMGEHSDTGFAVFPLM